MSDSSVELLNEHEINDFINSSSDWVYEEEKLKAKFELPTFADAIEVVNKIAGVCEIMDHHPLMTNVYNKLMFSIATHRVGDKVTELDVKLAKEISRIITEKRT